MADKMLLNKLIFFLNFNTPIIYPIKTNVSILLQGVTFTEY